MEEAINKPDNQFKALLNDIIDFTNRDKSSAIIKELTHQPINNTKPANSLNSSTYSSAASSSASSSSSSSSSSTSDSSNNPSSSTSSTLSSPSQSSETNNLGKVNNNENNENSSSNIEIAKIEDLGKKAKILGHKITAQQYKYSRDNTGLFSASLHSDKKSISNSTTKSLTAKNTAFTPANDKSNTTKTPAINNTTHTNLTPEGVISGDIWKTINGKRDKKRRKPTEQPVLSEDIPGHKGTREVDWLVNFIESGTGGSNNTNNSNKNSAKSKPQNKVENNNNHNSVSARNKNIGKNSSLSGTTSAPANNNTKKQESFPNINANKSHQAPAKMSAPTIQPKPLSLQSNVSNQPQQAPLKPNQGMNQGSQMNSRKPPLATNQNNEAQQQNLPVVNNISGQQTRQQYKPIITSQSSQTRNLSNRHKAPILSSSTEQSQSKPHSEIYESVKTEPQSSHDNKNLEIRDTSVPKEDIVTFADHICVDDKEPCHYTFGFFDESPVSKVNKSKSTGKSNHKQINQIIRESKSEHSKASLNSEKKRRKFNDNIDTTSFNYNQVLEFISNAWEITAKSRQSKSIDGRNSR